MFFIFGFELAEIFDFWSCSPESDTPQDLVLRGIRPHGICSAGFDTPQDLVLRDIRPHTGYCYARYKTLPNKCLLYTALVVCGVWYPTGLNSAGSDTPQDFVLLGIRYHRILFPRGLTPQETFSWGVSDPAGLLIPRGIGRRTIRELASPSKGILFQKCFYVKTTLPNAKMIHA
jgi:hypothetical protein